MWEELYETHYKELKAAASAMLRTACGSSCGDYAEDFVQETFLRAMRNADTVEELSKKQRRAWLFRTLKNLFYDRCRRASVEARYEQGIRTEAADDPELTEYENEQLLSAISPEDRKLFLLRYEEGYTSAELAEMFGLSAGTVRSRLSRCRQKLRETIDL